MYRRSYELSSRCRRGKMQQRSRNPSFDRSSTSSFLPSFRRPQIPASVTLLVCSRSPPFSVSPSSSHMYDGARRRARKRLKPPYFSSLLVSQPSELEQRSKPTADSLSSPSFLPSFALGFAVHSPQDSTTQRSRRFFYPSEVPEDRYHSFFNNDRFSGFGIPGRRAYLSFLLLELAEHEIRHSRYESCTLTRLSFYLRLFQVAAKKPQTFHYDRVLGPQEGQKELYEAAAERLVGKFMEGFNVTILA